MKTGLLLGFDLTYLDCKMAYALGKFAKGLCDRCGFEYKLLTLTKEWNGAKVCSECFEPKHPQLEVHKAPSDPESLYDPRPNNDVEVGEGFVVVSDANNFTDTSINFLTMNPALLGSKFVVSKVTGSVGTVTIRTS